MMNGTKTETEAELIHFFELSLDMLCIANTDGYFKRLNPAFTQNLGWKESELLDRPFWDFIHPNDQAQTEAEIKKLATGQKTIYFEHRFRTNTDDYKWLAWTAHPSHDGTLYASARDVTEQKEIQDSLAESRDLQLKMTENVPGMIYQFVMRPDGSAFFPFVSAWVSDTFGLTAGELKESANPIIALIHPDDMPSFEATVGQSAATMQPWRWEGRFVKKDGEVIYAQGQSKPEKLPNDYILWNGVLTDITDLKAAETGLARQAAELEIVTKISEIIAGTGQADQLMQEALNLTVESFNLYHAQIYEMNDVNSALLLTYGAGETGRQLVAQGHQIAFSNEQSLVAQAARSRQGVIENDLQAAPDYLPNPLLPESRSSLSIPMIVGDRLLGIWNVQANIVNQFSDEDIQIHSTLATQIGAVLQNTRSFNQAQQALEELNVVTRQLTRQGWEGYLSSSNADMSFSYDLHKTVPTKLDKTDAMMGQPLTIQGQTLGHLFLEEPGVRSESLSAVIGAVANRLSAHLETLRLTEEAERRAAALITVAEVSTTTATTLETDRLLQAVTDLTKERFGFYHAHIYLKEEDELVLAAGAGEVGEKMTSEGWRIPISQPQSLVARAARSGEGVIVNNVYDDPDYYPNPLLIETQSEMAVPMIVGNELIGILDVQSERPFAFNEEAIQIQSTLASQVAVAVQNARQYERAQAALEETQRQAERMALLSQISEKITVADSLDEIYEIAANEATQLFPSDRVTLSLLDETGKRAQVIAFGGDQGSVPVGVPQPIAGTLTEKVIQARRAMVIHDPASGPNRSINSAMVVPLISGTRVMGTINIGSKQFNQYDEKDETLTFQMASLLSAAIENQSLFAEQTATVKRLQELDEMKSSFLANMSHELRTPLNSVIGFTDVMLEGLDGPITDMMETDLKIIQTNGQHLLHLINDVLDMAKIEAGRMELAIERVNVHEILEEVVVMTAPLAKEKMLDLELISSSEEAELEIEADARKLKQVVVNLVGNAIKFTQKGSVTVQVARNMELVHVQVKDTGAGIEPNQAEKIFEAFRQADNSVTRKIGGTGLGLPISRRLVELHGGRLWVESSGIAGEGSTFHIQLPIEVRRSVMAQEAILL